MKDLNFFEPYVMKKKITTKKEYLYYLIILILVIIMLTYAIFNQMKIINLRKEIDKMKEIAEDSSIVAKVEEINKMKEELNFLRGYIGGIGLQKEYITEKSEIDNTLLEMLVASIPKGVFLTSVSMYSDEINIVGRAKDELLIAQLSENLEFYKPFKNIFISTISKENIFYSFNMDISLKEVELNGEDGVAQEE